MFDVARIICGCCDADVRREEERALVEDYYARLVKLMAKKARSVDFGMEQVVFEPMLARPLPFPYRVRM